jgi:hypothetical protein
MLGTFGGTPLLSRLMATDFDISIYTRAVGTMFVAVWHHDKSFAVPHRMPCRCSINSCSRINTLQEVTSNRRLCSIFQPKAIRRHGSRLCRSSLPPHCVANVLIARRPKGEVTNDGR